MHVIFLNIVLTPKNSCALTFCEILNNESNLEIALLSELTRYPGTHSHRLLIEDTPKFRWFQITSSWPYMQVTTTYFSFKFVFHILLTIYHKENWLNTRLFSQVNLENQKLSCKFNPANYYGDGRYLTMVYAGIEMSERILLVSSSRESDFFAYWGLWRSMKEKSFLLSTPVI